MTTPRVSPADTRTCRVFLAHAAEALHRFGTPAHGLEAAVRDTAQGLGLEARISATPTTMWLGTGPLEDQHVMLLRVQPGEVDLGRLVELDEVVQEVAEGRLGPADGISRLDRILAAPRRWAPVPSIAAGGVAAAGAVVLFRGSTSDLALAAILGTLVSAMIVLAERRPWLERVLLTVSAALASVVARLAGGVLPDVHPAIVGVSSVIVLLPGLSFTLALLELATANLVAGVARLAAASVTLLRLALGVALAQHLVPLGTELPPASPLPGWALPVALLLSPLAFGVFLQVRRTDLVVVWLASWAAYAGAALGAATLGPEVGAGLGAFVLAAVSSLYSRWHHRPTTTPMVTGILLLVPGSFGFRSLSALLEGNVLVGVEELFQMALIATSLAAGLLLGATVVPPRRAF